MGSGFADPHMACRKEIADLRAKLEQANAIRDDLHEQVTRQARLLIEHQVRARRLAVVIVQADLLIFRMPEPLKGWHSENAEVIAEAKSLVNPPSVAEEK